MTDMDNTEQGRSLRGRLKRSGQAELVLPRRRDPIGILEEQHLSRLAELVPVRIGRMSQSVFAFYRGTAAVMAADLAAGPHTGINVVCCGDAHVSNFGFYASPERALLFDLNDFDEASIAPWEWDVKRLAASVHVGGRDIGMSEEACRDATQRTVAAYRESLQSLMQLTALERYYYKVDADLVQQMLASEQTRKAVKKARKRTSDQLLAKITMRDEKGRGLCIVDQPPVTRHVSHGDVDELGVLFQQYMGTLREDTAWLLSQFKLVDSVLRVVGVGSVGTRCYVLAFEGPQGEVLFLQAKEAQPSVLTTYGGMPPVIPGAEGTSDHNEGHRVVAGQRILQAQSDPFIGHIVGWAGETDDRLRVDYYWRQFRDMKGSIDLATLDGTQFTAYGELCGRLLARAHSQSPGAAAIAGYLGSGAKFDEAVSAWSAAYADQCEADYDALKAAIKSGRLPAETEA
ncbi:DUF2252 domain-containing protein [Paracoccus caeni]|uniref:DUF2252 domain-containing protein n=1 Tax=Paracoccus caeni TaxID=657651 RepID=A0A934SJT5_9RHOB|nr:DUF2252 domain-containing protein [Paracoccus caeni]MBK4216409.1 DUF2252 domain-containing protein [Paracoccus caeni]